ncbi:MAG: hypothetical protein CSB34_00860 [Desulfobulbus propionicus]|nr:MAG: hypothetical protein CSB34_00860 [Desulfobulbus propionicus]
MAQKSGWYPANIDTIKETISALSQSRKTATPVAVFDFDNTCIFRDIGQATFRYQLYNLRYKIDPQTFSSLFPTVPQKLAGRPMQEIKARLVAQYQKLWPLIQELDISQAMAQPSYEEFTALLLWFTDKARKEPQLGPLYVLPLLAQLFGGFSTTELEALAIEVLNEVGKEPLEKQTVERTLDEPFGTITTSFAKGLRPYQEMQDLMQWLSEHGVTCCVISASTEWLVRATAKTLGYAVQPQNIYGIRTTVASDGILKAEMLPEYPLTFREGKAEVIRKFIGKTPVLVAGDADTDYEMLTFANVPLRLIINRNQKGAISSLYDDPNYLLQGIDSTAGTFRPSRKTMVS